MLTKANPVDGPRSHDNRDATWRRCAQLARHALSSFCDIAANRSEPSKWKWPHLSVCLSLWADWARVGGQIGCLNLRACMCHATCDRIYGQRVPMPCRSATRPYILTLLLSDSRVGIEGQDSSMPARPGRLCRGLAVTQKNNLE